jgi:hypothetical protein
MSILYLIALAGVALALMAMLYEAVASVGRKPHWMRPATAGLTGAGDDPAESLQAAPALQLVEAADRRAMELPFVGQDRRQSSRAAERAASARRAASGR